LCLKPLHGYCQDGDTGHDVLRRRYCKVADYSMRLLVRLLILFILIIAALTPLVMFFMAVYEGREISVATTGYGELLPFYIGSSSELIEKSLGEVKIRIFTGATVAAIWNSDGTITTPSAYTTLKESSLIVLGPDKNVEKLACFIGGPGSGEHVVLVGAGRVGQQAGKRLNQAGINPHVINILEKLLSFNGKLIVGDATFAGSNGRNGSTA